MQNLSFPKKFHDKALGNFKSENDETEWKSRLNSAALKISFMVTSERRATVSVMSNIAEGFERGGNRKFIQFLYIARGSCGEVRSQLYVALDQGYIDQGAFDGIMKSSRRLSVIMSNFVNYLKNSSMKGQKFKRP